MRPFRRIREEGDRELRSETRRGIGVAVLFFVLLAGAVTWLTVIEAQTNSTVQAVRAEQLGNQQRFHQNSAAAIAAVYDFAALESELGTIIIANHLSLPKGEGVNCVPNTKTFAVKCSLIKTKEAS